MHVICNLARTIAVVHSRVHLQCRGLSLRNGTASIVFTWKAFSACILSKPAMLMQFRPLTVCNYSVPSQHPKAITAFPRIFGKASLSGVRSLPLVAKADLPIVVGSVGAMLLRSLYCTLSTTSHTLL